MPCDVISRLQHETPELRRVEGVVRKLRMVPEGWVVALRGGERGGGGRVSQTTSTGTSRNVSVQGGADPPCPGGRLCSFSAKSHIERPAVEPNPDSSSRPHSYIWEGGGGDTCTHIFITRSGSVCQNAAKRHIFPRTLVSSSTLGGQV